MDDASGLSQRIGVVVRDRRAARSWSLGDLARATGLSKTILARIERGEGNPSIETLWRVARALAVPLSTLLAEDEAPRVRRIDARSGEHLRAQSGMDAWLVHAEGRDGRSELFELAFPAGAAQRTAGHLPGTREVVVCTAGALRVGPVGETVALGEGDAAWFAADADHEYVAEDGAARALCLIHYPGGTR